MRPLALLAGVLFGAGAMGIAQAQSLTEASRAALVREPLILTLPADDIGFAQREAAFASGGALLQQNTTAVSRRTFGGAIDTVRLRSAQTVATPQVYAGLRPDAYTGGGAYDVDYTRTWPAAIRGSAGAYEIDVSPQAGVGYGSAGGSLSGGAMVRLIPPSRDAKVVERLKAMGVKDGASYGDQGRWYLFAAARGRAVGLNMAREGAGLRRDGWSTDPVSLVGDAQVGLGWRKGDMQTSLGYMVRRMRIEDPYSRRFVDMPGNEQIAGISFSYRPTRR